MVGNRDQWYGNLAYNTKTHVDDVSRYYLSELKKDGWSLQSQMVADRTVLQFVNSDRGRASMITIAPGTMWSKTRVEIVVSPTATRVSALQ